MRKILVSDYDQTFYLNDEDIEKNKKSVEEFRKKKEIYLCLQQDVHILIL